MTWHNTYTRDAIETGRCHGDAVGMGVVMEMLLSWAKKCGTMYFYFFAPTPPRVEMNRVYYRTVKDCRNTAMYLYINVPLMSCVYIKISKLYIMYIKCTLNVRDTQSVCVWSTTRKITGKVALTVTWTIVDSQTS